MPTGARSFGDTSFGSSIGMAAVQGGTGLRARLSGSRSVLAEAAVVRMAGVLVALAGLWLAVVWAVAVP